MCSISGVASTVPWLLSRLAKAAIPLLLSPHYHYAPPFCHRLAGLTPIIRSTKNGVMSIEFDGFKDCGSIHVTNKEEAGEGE